MRPRHPFWSADTVIVLLCAVCAALAVLLALSNPVFLLPVLAVPAVVAAVLALAVGRLRRLMRRAVGGRGALGGQGPSGGVASFGIPVMAVSAGLVVWYNEPFLHGVALGAESMTLPAHKVVPGLDLRAAAAPQGQNIRIGGRCYTAYCNMARAEKDLCFVMLIDDTGLKTDAWEYAATRPSVMYILVDTYDEVLKELRESDRALVMSAVDIALERFVGGSSGFLRRISSSRYLAVVEERHIREMMASRFSVLDEARRVDEEGASVTLSIGVGRLGKTLGECEAMAAQALDMALGRGGDQAAVKSPDGFEFYGGVAQSVERRTKVKSRIVASAIRDAIGQYDKVLIMGHRNSDMDAVGASVGMLRFCRLCGKPAAVVVDTNRTMAELLIGHLERGGYGEDFISPEDALSLTGPRTLAVVVDTHMRRLVESEQVLGACGAAVVIDHHRRMVGHIEDALIFYHEPYASSASELVSELLQYVGDGKENRIAPAEAEAMLAGIMLDTLTFSIHVGVRTFEAAAWLRRMGAQTSAVKKMFVSTMNEYLYRSHLVSEARVHHRCAIALSDKVPVEHEVTVPQAANELLSIEGIDASFVGILVEDTVRVSARSMGEVNVQLIMEKIGGGGHLTMAGAQLAGFSIEHAGQTLARAVTEYMAERAGGKN